MEVQLDVGAVHPLAPGVQVVLGLGEIAVIAGGQAEIGLAHRHGAFRQRTVHRVLEGGAQPDPFVAEAALDPVLDHRFQQVAGDFIADPMLEAATQPLFLDCLQLAVLIVMHAGQAVLGELGRNEGHAVQHPLSCLFGGELFPLADLEKDSARAIGDPAVQFATGILVEGAAIRIGRGPGHTRQLEGLAVDEDGMAATMYHHDRMVRRHLVQVADVQWPLFLQLGVVVEPALDPGAGRQRGCLGLQLGDNTVDADVMHEPRAAGMGAAEHPATAVIVRVDKARRHHHALGVDDPGFPARQAFDVVAADGDKAPGAYREGIGLGQRAVHGMDAGIVNDQVGLLRIGEGRRGKTAGTGSAGQRQEVPAIVPWICCVHAAARRARWRRSSSTCKTRSAMGKAAATQPHTNHSAADSGSWKKARIALTSRKIRAQAKLRIIHCRCCCMRLVRIMISAMVVANIQMAASITVAMVKLWEKVPSFSSVHWM